MLDAGCWSVGLGIRECLLEDIFKNRITFWVSTDKEYGYRYWVLGTGY